MAIRVCQLITELRPAGAERCVYELATRLGALGVETDVIALRGGAVAEALAAAGVDVRVLGVRGKWDLLKFLRLRRWLREGSYDILHTHLFHADLVGRLAARRAGTPHLVHSVHVAERRFRPWRFTWARWMRRRCERIICVSDGVRDDHARRSRIDLDRYAVIHNGVDLDRYRPDAARRAELRDRWALGDADVLCAFVGRLDKQKGIDLLCEGFARAAAACPRLHLVVAGDGPRRSFLQRWLDGSPYAARVRVLGFTEDVPGVLAASDIFLQPSRWEGFCLAAAEAMAAGLPVAASDVAGLNEVVDPGRTGLLCKSGSPRAFAAAIVTLADDGAGRRRLGAAGRTRVAERFSLDRFIRQHAALYEQVAAGGS